MTEKPVSANGSGHMRVERTLLSWLTDPGVVTEPSSNAGTRGTKTPRSRHISPKNMTVILKALLPGPAFKILDFDSGLLKNTGQGSSL